MLNIGSRLELLIDDYLIDTMDGARLQLQHPVPRDVVMVYDTQGTLGHLEHPWEGNTSGFFSVIFPDNGRYKMYYRGSNWTMERGYQTHEVACYAESPDGIHWSRPELGLFEFEGSKKNNIVWPHVDEAASWFAFKDPNPAVPGTERYKAAGGMDLKGMPGLVSPDGIHWTKLEKPLIPDDLNTDWGQSVFWNPLDEKYHAYLRYWEGGDESHKVHSGYRSLRHMSSDDFYNWSPWTPLTYENPPNDHMQIYMNNIRPYERAPHILIGPVKRFTPERKKHPDHPYPGLSDGGLMTSRDGLHFKIWQEAFNRPGPDPKQWIQRNLVPVNGILQTSPGELSLYWIEHYYSHFPDVEPGVEGCRMRRGTIRTDGFVSMYAPYAGGEFVTKSFLFEGRELVLNYATSAMGSVRVEMQEEGGRPMEGYKLAQCPDIFGDEIEHVVSWEGGGDMKRLEGTPVRLRFVLKDADLYSFRFRSV
jgi:hypothetical protein